MNPEVSCDWLPFTRVIFEKKTRGQPFKQTSSSSAKVKKMISVNQLSGLLYFEMQFICLCGSVVYAVIPCITSIKNWKTPTKSVQSVRKRSKQKYWHFRSIHTLEAGGRYIHENYQWLLSRWESESSVSCDNSAWTHFWPKYSQIYTKGTVRASTL